MGKHGDLYAERPLEMDLREFCERAEGPTIEVDPETVLKAIKEAEAEAAQLRARVEGLDEARRAALAILPRRKPPPDSLQRLVNLAANLLDDDNLSSPVTEAKEAVVKAAIAWHVWQTKMQLGLLRATCFNLAKLEASGQEESEE